MPLILGCEEQKSESRPSQAETQKEQAPVFAPSFESIQGEWYVVATNPAIAGRIITDYITFGYRPDSTVIRIVRSNGEIDTQRGKYSWDPEIKQIEAKIDLGEAGIQVWTWRQDNPGKATIVYWKNLSKGHEYREDDVYIKRGIDEWQQRQKEKLNTNISVSFIDPFDLKANERYRLSEETPLMPHYDPPDPMAALKSVKKMSLGTVIEILLRTEKGPTTWYKVRQEKNEGWINSIALVGQTLKKL